METLICIVSIGNVKLKLKYEVTEGSGAGKDTISLPSLSFYFSSHSTPQPYYYFQSISIVVWLEITLIFEGVFEGKLKMNPKNTTALSCYFYQYWFWNEYYGYWNSRDYMDPLAAL